jgi:hypothetical protein
MNKNNSHEKPAIRRFNSHLKTETGLTHKEFANSSMIEPTIILQSRMIQSLGDVKT